MDFLAARGGRYSFPDGKRLWKSFDADIFDFQKRTSIEKRPEQPPGESDRFESKD